VISNYGVGDTSLYYPALNDMWQLQSLVNFINAYDASAHGVVVLQPKGINAHFSPFEGNQLYGPDSHKERPTILANRMLNSEVLGFEGATLRDIRSRLPGNMRLLLVEHTAFFSCTDPCNMPASAILSSGPDGSLLVNGAPFDVMAHGTAYLVMGVRRYVKLAEYQAELTNAPAGYKRLPTVSACVETQARPPCAHMEGGGEQATLCMHGNIPIHLYRWRGSRPQAWARCARCATASAP